MTDDESTSEESRSRPGRPRSEQSRAAVLRAASELMHEVGLRGMTTEQIAIRSGASKATIYKWWPNKYAVAVEAFLTEMAVESADPDTGHALEDFRGIMRGLFHFYTSPSGRVFAQLVGEAQFDPVVAAHLRDHLIRSRRKQSLKIWARGVARGELRPDVDPEVAVDLIFGPALYRLVAGHAAFDDATADAMVDAAVVGLRAVTDRTQPAGNTIGRPNAESIRN
jgi:AcrR family transcriptional regulator